MIAAGISSITPNRKTGYISLIDHTSAFAETVKIKTIETIGPTVEDHK